MTCSFEEQLWMKYLDGVLSQEEMRRFWRPLSQELRKNHMRELSLEQALGKALYADLHCPDKLWRHLQRTLRTPLTPFVTFNKVT